MALPLQQRRQRRRQGGGVVVVVVVNVVLTLLLLMLLAILPSVTGQLQGTTACRNRPSTMGYTSIDALNTAMLTELSKITSANSSTSTTNTTTYILTLCPDTIFDATISELQPVLSGAVFQCGDDGALQNNHCIIRGGISNQVSIVDSTITGYILQTVAFHGIIFEQFGGSSIAAHASHTTSATFTNCQWRDFTSFTIVFQDYVSLTIPAMTVEIFDSDVRDGRSDEAMFWNGNGNLTIVGLTVTNATVRNVISTLSGGTSNIQNVNVSQSDIQNSVFYTYNTGSTATFRRTSITTMTQSSNWTGFQFDNGASGTIVNSKISNNVQMKFGIIANKNAVVTVIGSALDNNVFDSQQPFRLSAAIASIRNSSVVVQDTTVHGDTEATAQVFVNDSSLVTLTNTSFVDVASITLIFVSSNSNYTLGKNPTPRNATTLLCFSPIFAIFKENQGSNCFSGNNCNGICQTFLNSPTPVAVVRHSRRRRSKRSRKQRRQQKKAVATA